MVATIGILVTPVSVLAPQSSDSGRILRYPGVFLN